MKMKSSIPICIILFASLFHFSCQSITQTGISDQTIAEGKTIAEKNCQSCHLFPDPQLADSKTWENGILPQMGPRLGVFFYQGLRYPSYRFDFSTPTNYYPSQQKVSDEDWQKIIDYYKRESKDKNDSIQTRKYPIINDFPLFEVLIPSNRPNQPASTLVKFDTSSRAAPIVVSDAMNHTIKRYDAKFQLMDSMITNGPVVDIEINKSNWLICDIGILNPNNGKNGSINKLIKNASNKLVKVNQKPEIDLLQRPVQLISADFNNDGKPDQLICEFGFLSGSLSWMENKGNGKYEKHILKGEPGAIKAVVDDYNHDGLPDIWVLFTQGEEGVFLYSNKGNGKFTQTQVLRFPPVNGSSYFELADMNQDGFKDIIYTCGDNADYSTVLKSYHGVYIYLNDGKNNFTEKFFFPINGCYKAVARDFDNDGDLDLATISFFADYEHQPEEGFVYLENQGNLDFKPFSLPATKKGRWLTMDVADFDHDGKPDIILGNFSLLSTFQQIKTNWKEGPAFMVLKNTGLMPKH
jgi:hypothetical protein